MGADRRHASRPARTLFAACVALGACTVEGEDGATSLGGTTVPSTSATTATTTVGSATATSATTAMTSSDSGSESEESDDSIDDTSPPTSDDTSPSDDSSGGATGPDEQPADGVYSECETVVQCFGTTACVTIASEGFCSIACTIPSECPPSPGGTATPACVLANISGVDMTVCALDCGLGKTCPGGMSCAALGSSMVCV